MGRGSAPRCASADDKGIKRLRRIAEKCAWAAEQGDMQAIREIGDRLDGKAPQALTGELTGSITVKIVA